MQLRPLIRALGIMIGLFAVAMIPCALVDIVDGDPEAYIFVASAFLSGLTGGTFWLMSRGGSERIGQREAFLLTVSVWVFLPAVAAVPFIAAGYTLTDSLFESISGLTTTGATVFTGLQELPRGLLLWRGILQWIGGIGIIVTAIAILPQLRVGGMQLFALESTDISGKFLPRITDIATFIGTTYVVVSLACAIGYYLSGMSWFEAVVHTMSTVSAGGFTASDASFRDYAGTAAIYVAIVFMIIAALPFSLLAMALLQARFRPILVDPQVRLLLGLILFISLLIFVYILSAGTTGNADPPAILFNVVSVITGTGYASASYDSWGNFVVVVFLITSFLGGCAGSAACGIKMFRIEITAKALLAWSKRMVQPHRVVPVRYAGRPIGEDVLQSVMVFIFLYIVTFLVSAALLSLTGLDALTAISGAAASVSNVGPGLGPVIGPDGHYGTLTDFAKWVCAIAMLLGRLEFVAVFVVLTARFWRG